MTELAQFASAAPHVSLAAEALFRVGGVAITNSLLLGVLGYVIVLGYLLRTAYVVKHHAKRSFVVKLIIWGYETLYGTVLHVVGDAKITRTFAPLPITLFFFIITQYYLGILPFVGPVMFDGAPLLRGFGADLNTTFGLAIITLVTAQIYAIKVHGVLGNIGRYLRNPFKDPMGAFEGILEIIAEFSRTIALSLRLFGNVFAGEVLLVMVSFLTHYFAVFALPPFYIFELFIGAIQAYIFFMLTTVFVSLGLAKHDAHDVHSPSPKAATAVPARE